MVVKKSAFKDSNTIMISKGTPLAVYVFFKKENYIYEVSPQTDKLMLQENINKLKIKWKFDNRIYELGFKSY